MSAGEQETLHSNESSKISNGDWFNPQDRALVEQRRQAKALCRELNNTPPENFKACQKIARQLFAQVDGCYIEPHFFCDYGKNIYLGKRFFANHNCTILDAAKVTIGDEVLLGPNVQILTNNHPLAPQERIKGAQQAKPITIGNHVWIGGGAIILPGVSIGDGAVVAAGSVVKEDVPERHLVAGNPAQKVRLVAEE